MTLPEFAIILSLSLSALLFFGLGARVGQKTAEDEIKDTIEYCQDVRDQSFHDCLHKHYKGPDHE